MGSRGRVAAVVCLIAILLPACGAEDAATSTTNTTSAPIEGRQVVAGPDGASVELSREDAAGHDISVTPIDSLDGLLPTGDPEGFSGGVLLEPHGLTFTTPVVVTIPLTKQQSPGRSLRLFHWDGVGTSWEETGFIVEVGADGWTASGEVTHFSYYVLQPSGVDAEADGIFGDVEGTVLGGARQGDDLATLTRAVFDTAIGHVNGRFPFDDPRPFDLPAVNGYNCYVPVGMFFLFDHGSEGIETPLVETIGDIDNGELRIDYIREVDVQFKAGGVEHDLFGTLVANVYWRSRPPDIEVVGSRTALWSGESAKVTATLSCGGHPMVGSEVDFSIRRPQPFVRLTEELGFTGSDGAVTTTLNTSEGASGIITVDADHLWTDLAGDAAVTMGDFVHVSLGGLTGTWSITGTERWSNCFDPLDNGTYRGTAQVTFVQTDDTFIGSGSFPRVSELIQGTVARTGPTTFTVKGNTHYVEDWDGWTVAGTSEFSGTGSMETGTIDFTWSGADLAGDTCTFSGEGRGTRR